jgi:predicted enzyme related to lactoylglutathione lyase
MTAPDPLDDLLAALRFPAAVDPDPAFAARLRARVERALLDTPTSYQEDAMPTTTAAAVATLHTVAPYLAVRDAREALAFYGAAFHAVPRGEPIVMPDGRIGHAEVAIGDSVLMLAEEFPEIGLLAPVSRGGPSQSLRLEVDDPDAVVDRALAAGARLDRPVDDSPYGRTGVVLDPSGHRWMVSREAPVAAAPVPPRPGEVVYASVWTPDVARAADFYAAVLGWAVESGPDPDGRRVTNLPTPVGLYGGRRSTTFLCFAVPDVDAAAALVRAAGGTAEEPVDEPWGRVADCVDDQGLPFALQSGPPGPAPDPTTAGAMTYLTIEVPDATRARAFYGTVLGWRFTPGRVEHGWNVTLATGEARPMTGVWGGRSGDAIVTPMYVVRDVAAAVATVRARGGSSTDPDRQPYGTSAECTDDQGGRFYLVQY